VSKQVPAVDHNKEQDFQRRRNNHGRKLKHPDRGSDGGCHHIDKQEWQKQNGPNAKYGFQLREDVRGHDHAHRQLVGGVRPWKLTRSGEQGKIFLTRVSKQEELDGLRTAIEGLPT